MNKASDTAVAAPRPAPARESSAELLRSNEALREELRELRIKNAELARQLAEARSGIKADCETRRAALNLLEDAMEARRAQQLEIIERRRAEQELRQANRRKDEFLATLAHELRNPLAPIRNSIQILRHGRAESGDIERAQELLERQVNHLVRLVDDLMEVSRITHGKIKLCKEPLEVATVVRSAVEASRPIIETGRHQLEVGLPAETLTVSADPIRLAQVLTNLLNNAAKYTREGGRIWLSVRREDGGAVISVRDSGIGIPREMLDKVFDLFTQIDRPPGGAPTGLGIGLTLVRTLVEAHGGSVEARSEGTGRGSEFVVRLPLSSGEASPEGGRGHEGRPRVIATRRVLVVDDNRDAAESLGTLLRFLGLEVRVVNDGNAALEEIEEFHPSVVLLDIGMPGMDGNEVARRVRQRPEGGDVKLIALTGWGQEEDRRRSRQAGFDYHLVKPVDFDALETLLASIQ